MSTPLGLATVADTRSRPGTFVWPVKPVSANLGGTARVRYLIAILLPPLGMLSVGKFLEAFLCLLLMLTVIGHPIAAIWAVLVVHSSLADGRTRRIERATRAAAAR